MLPPSHAEAHSDKLDDLSGTSGSKRNNAKVYEKHTSLNRAERTNSIQNINQNGEYASSKGFKAKCIDQSLRLQSTSHTISKNYFKDGDASDQIKFLENLVFNLQEDLRKCRQENKGLREENRELKLTLNKAGLSTALIGSFKHDQSKSIDQSYKFGVPLKQYGNGLFIII